MIWRLVLERVATLREIEESWSIIDVLDCNTALDLKEEAERLAAETRKEA